MSTRGIGYTQGIGRRRCTRSQRHDCSDGPSRQYGLQFSRPIPSTLLEEKRALEKPENKRSARPHGIEHDAPKQNSASLFRQPMSTSTPKRSRSLPFRRATRSVKSNKRNQHPPSNQHHSRFDFAQRVPRVNSLHRRRLLLPELARRPAVGLPPAVISEAGRGRELRCSVGVFDVEFEQPM